MNSRSILLNLIAVVFAIALVGLAIFSMWKEGYLWFGGLLLQCIGSVLYIFMQRKWLQTKEEGK